MTENSGFLGYRRRDGQVGIRNHVAVMAAMDNINGVVTAIGEQVRGTLPLPIWYGRGQFGQDAELTEKTLAGLGRNPNFGAVLVVSLEPVSARRLAEAIAVTGKPVEWIAVNEGNSPMATARGAEIAAELVSKLSEQPRVRLDLGDLVIGVECGGSDTSSGIATNPILGRVADAVVDAGGTVVLTETSEFIGAEHVLAKRAKNDDVRQRILASVKRIEDDARARGVNIAGANPVPDNIAGGLTTIEEKSLGAILKGGTRTIQDVITYADQPPGKGLYVMDTPAPASESMTGISAGGAHLILFATGKGNIVGSPVSPTIKVSSNPDTVRTMPVNIDLDTSAAFKGTGSIDDEAGKLLELVLKTSSGKMTRSEILKTEQIALARLQPTI